jgi:hypothetical protein
VVELKYDDARFATVDAGVRREVLNNAALILLASGGCVSV